MQNIKSPGKLRLRKCCFSQSEMSSKTSCTISIKKHRNSDYLSQGQNNNCWTVAQHDDWPKKFLLGHFLTSQKLGKKVR